MTENNRGVQIRAQAYPRLSGPVGAGSIGPPGDIHVLLKKHKNRTRSLVLRRQ